MLPSITFLIATTLLAITPGPGIAYVVARTVAGGKGEGYASSFGTAVGGLMHVVAAALGLSLIIAKSPVAYAVLTYLGAAYLLYLGIKILSSKTSASTELPKVEREGVRKAFRDGIVVEALNVKTAMFFLAFIPQFVSAKQPLVPQFLLLGAICVTLNTTADILAVAAANRFIGSSEARASRERLLSRVSGVVMIGLGLFVAFAHTQQ